MKKMNEEMGSSLMDLIKGKTHEEAREAIIKSIQEDLITQSLLSGGMSSDLLRNVPKRFMDKQVYEAFYGESGMSIDSISPFIDTKSIWLAGVIMDSWPERLACDIRIDRIAPPEALKCHGEAAVADYRASMSRDGFEALAQGSLWRVILCPMVIRGAVDSALKRAFGNDEGIGFMLYELISSVFTGVSIDLDLAAYHAVMNYDAALKHMKSEEGLTIAYGEKGEFLVVRMTDDPDGGLPAMTLVMGVFKR
jgi:hypothetical protein